MALKETQELLKQEREEVATLKVEYFVYTKFLYLHCYCFPHQAQLDLAEQNKGSVDIEEIMKEKYVFG